MVISYSITKGDITEANVDIIINASNGVGYMGGTLGKYIKLPGVAESIHYKSKGSIEKEAKLICKTDDYSEGDIFVTSSGNLPSKCILHAVTMKKPGSKSNIKTIETLLPRIIYKARELNAKSVAIPLLGTGTGGLSKKEILGIYSKVFSIILDLDIIVYTK